MSRLFGTGKTDRADSGLTREEYKAKLHAFNSTEKYQSELAFLIRLLNVEHKDRILDYGCGTGYAMRHIEAMTDAICYGYDIHPHYYEGDPFKFRMELYFKVNTVYFMHSLAHMLASMQTPLLESLKANFLETNGRVVVITPNQLFLDDMKIDVHKSDPTVVQHFSPFTLQALFESCGYKIETIGQFGAHSPNGHGERIFLAAQA